jgi:hypothetical protein
MPVFTWSGTGQQRHVRIFIAMERWVERTVLISHISHQAIVSPVTPILFFLKGGGAHRVRPCLDPHLLYVMWTQDLFACVNWKLSLMISPWILIWNDVKGSFYFLEAVAFFYHIKSCQYCWNVIRYPYMYLIQKWLLGNRLGTLSRNDS